jgi:AbiV family abortive infection protein
LTSDLLLAYADSALINSSDLLTEASLLLNNGHNARAFFLAISSIEETGKALHAFDAQLRNLNEPAVSTRLKVCLENHRQKITYALGIWALNDTNPRAALEKALDLILHLAHGREPSMYSDLRIAPDRVQTPREVVRDVSARDCVRLAEACHANARRHFNEKA